MRRRKLTCVVTVASAALLGGGCGRIVDPPGRDPETPPYLEFVNEVPSFWTRGVEGEVVVPILLRDDQLPEGVSLETLRDIVTAAVATWLEPLQDAGRRVTLPVMFALEGHPRPARGVQVVFTDRALGFVGVTTYNGDQVDVEVAVTPVSLERFVTRRELLALTLHEMGHALGISQPGHSLNPNDVMFGHHQSHDWITLSGGDREVILALFPE